MSLKDEIRREIRIGQDRLSGITFQTATTSYCDVVDMALDLGLSTWPKEWRNKDSRIITWSTQETPTKFARGRRNNAVDGILKISAIGEWTESRGIVKPYISAESYTFYGYGKVLDDSFYTDGWSCVGKSGPRNPYHNDSRYIQATMRQLKVDGPAFDPELSRVISEIEGPSEYPQHYPKSGEQYHTESLNWAQQIEKELMSKKGAENSERVKLAAYEKAVKEALHGLPYSPRAELAKLGSLTWDGKEIRPDDIPLWLERTRGEIDIPGQEYWRANLMIQNRTFGSSTESTERFAISCVGVLDPESPDPFTISSWKGWGKDWEKGISSGVSGEEFGEMLKKLYHQGPHTDTRKLVPLEPPIIPPNVNLTRPQRFTPPPPQIIVVGPPVPFRPSSMSRGTHWDGGV